LNRLPGILGRIADVAGVAAALKLAHARGGTEMKISGRAGGALAQIVGDDAAAKIAELLGPEKYTIPMAHVRGARGRREMVAKLLKSDASVREIAQAADVHERTVYRVQERRDGQHIQPTLPFFDEEA